MSEAQMPTAIMSSQVNGLALFTVEQIELVRRLRNSGITKEQIIQAFEAMDRLDRELGPVYSLPVTLQALQHVAFQRQNLLSAQQAANVVAANNAAITAAMVAAAAAQQQQLHPQVSQTAAQPQQQPQQQQPPQSQLAQQQTPQQAAAQQVETVANNPSQPVITTVVNCGVKRPADSPVPQQQAQQQNIDLSNITLPVLSNGLLEFPDDGENYMEEYKEFIAMGEQYCCEQIRNFVIRYSIKQQQIATLAGVSQSYVSRFLKGDVYEMSERSRRAIQKWYIMYRKNPAAIAHAVNAVLITNGSPPKKLAIDMSPAAAPNGEFVCYTKRERFVFRPNHLDILEKHFQEDNYPSQEKRELISQLCNNASLAVAGRVLSEKETVTPQIVGNWFANKRKELKKIAREEGLDVSQVPLRPRGRPCRLLSDLITMVHVDHGSNHSETASTDNSSHEISPNQQPPPAQGQDGLIHNHDVNKNNNNDTGENGQCRHNGNMAEEHDNGDVCGRHEQDDEALSMSVELAAVNQAILSLTGTQPININKPDSVPQQMIVKQELPTTVVKQERAQET